MASPLPAPSRKVRNSRTRALWRRDLLWQITLPLGLAVVAALVLMVLVAAPVGAHSRSPLADVSLIVLIFPAAVAGLVLLVLLGALIWGLAYALRELPYVLKHAQDWAALAAYQVRVSADQVAGVFLSTRSYTASAQKAAKDIRSVFTFWRSG